MERIDRTVVVTTMHPPTGYHFELGLNVSQSVANWDTSGEVTVTIPARVGDNILYLMTTNTAGTFIGLTR